MLVVPAPASLELGTKVANLAGLHTMEVKWKRFPDGECCLSFAGEVRDQELVLIQSTYPPQDTHLMQLLLLIDAAVTQGAKRVSAAVPYLAYARQDKPFSPYETISIKTVLKLLTSCKLANLVTVDVHEPEALHNEITVMNVSAIGLLGEYLKTLNLKEPVSVAPDKKAKSMANTLSGIIGGSTGWFSKIRDKASGEIQSMRWESGDVSGKDALVIDDIISSGKTTAQAVKALKELGAKRVYSVCVHALLAEDAYDRIKQSGATEVIATDTIPSKVSIVSVAPVLAKTLKNQL